MNGSVLTRVCLCGNGCDECRVHDNIYFYSRHCNEMDCDEPVTRYLYWSNGHPPDKRKIFIAGSCDKHWKSIHKQEVLDRRWKVITADEFDVLRILEAELKI